MNSAAPGDNKKQKFESWKNKLVSYGVDKASVTPQGVSTAMDIRLEHGVELQAELRLRVSWHLLLLEHIWYIKGYYKKKWGGGLFLNPPPPKIEIGDVSFPPNFNRLPVRVPSYFFLE